MPSQSTRSERGATGRGTGLRKVVSINSHAELKNEFNSFRGSHDKSVISDILGAITTASERPGFTLPLNIIVFKSDHDIEIPMEKIRADFEAQCMIAFQKNAIREHTRKSILDRLKRFLPKDVSLEIIEGKRIKVEVT